MLARKVKLVADLARKRPKGWQSLLWNSTMAQLRRPGPLMAPVHVSIEPTNACNARCPVCETGKGDMARRTGFLDPHLFRAFIDDAAPTTAVLLYYFMGEPFMHRSSYDMIRYAREKGIYVETCTNGDFVDPEGVIYSDINRISFQIGGMDQATHERYRVRTRLDKAFANLETLVALKRKHPRSSVEIEVGFTIAGIVGALRQFPISYRPEGMVNSRHVDLAELASELGARHTEERDTDLLCEFARDVRAELMIVAGWHRVVPARLRKQFSLPCLGLHASLLPRYRGGSPLNWAILNGDTETGVSVFGLADGVDAGPLYGQARFAIASDDDISEVVRKAELAFLSLLAEVVPGVLSGRLAPRSQEGEPIYTLQRFPEDGCVDWTWPADRIDRLVRATTRPYPGAFTLVDGQTLRLWRVRRLTRPVILGTPGQVAALKTEPSPIVVTGSGLLAIEDATFDDGSNAIDRLRALHNRKLGQGIR